MAHNQELLRLSKFKHPNDSTSLIEFSARNVSFANETGTFIITLANANDIIEITKTPNEKNVIDVIADEQIICTESQTIRPNNTIDIEQEFEDFASKDIVAELRVEDENENGCNEDEDDHDDADEDLPASNVDATPEAYKDFPSKILDGCKLLYKGHDLLDMISRFYRLECDQCV